MVCKRCGKDISKEENHTIVRNKEKDRVCYKCFWVAVDNDKGIQKELLKYKKSS